MTDASPMYVDDRAGSERLLRIEPVASLAVSCRLDAGDVMIVGNGPNDTNPLVGVEVKSIFDLISSINTGRFQATQLPGLRATYDEAWLLYYGPYRLGENGSLQVRRGGAWRGYRLGIRPVPYGYLEGLLCDLAWEGLNIKHVYDEREAAAWLGVLYRWWSKPWGRHKGLRTFDRSREVSLMPHMDADIKYRACVAKEFPGVGIDKAVAAALHFASVADMINADTREWEKVDGIGRVLARAIVDANRR